MARPTTIQDQELIDRLSNVFRDLGYSGASLANLSSATGLKRASLYHRFPDGKKQMASEVLDNANERFYDMVLKPLNSDEPKEVRIEKMASGLDTFYNNGEESCLLNVLSTAPDAENVFEAKIKHSFTSFIDALINILMEAGVEQESAKIRALSLASGLQGSLVLSRGIGSNEPFKQFVKALPVKLMK